MVVGGAALRVVVVGATRPLGLSRLSRAGARGRGEGAVAAKPSRGAVPATASTAGEGHMVACTLSCYSQQHMTVV